MKSLLGLIDRLKFGRVEFLVEKISTVISESIESLSDSFNQSESLEFGKSGAGMASRAHIKILDSLRRQVSLITHRLQDAFVDGPHPISALSSHINAVLIVRHTFTDVRDLATQLFESAGVSLSDDCKSLANYL